MSHHYVFNHLYSADESGYITSLFGRSHFIKLSIIEPRYFLGL